MPNVIEVKRKRKTSISRSASGDGIVRIDRDSTDIVEEFLEKSEGQVSVKELVSSMIKYAANDTIIKIIDEED